MLLSTALIAGFVSIPAAAARAFDVFGTQSPLDESLKIPGESPLYLCDKAHDVDIAKIEKVDLSPNPPTAGNELVIKASGTVSETVYEGAYVALQVKYGLIRLISTKADLCEQVKNVDMECPIEPGKIEVTKSVELPKEIPNGKYTVLADVYTNDSRPITCLTAQIVFGGDKKTAEIEL